MSRVPPHSIEAEESLLGAMLLQASAIGAALDVGLVSGDFYKPAHGFLFTAITGLYADGGATDAVTVAEVLRRADQFDAIGGGATLISLQTNTPASKNAGRYAAIVRDYSTLRQLIALGSDLVANAYDGQRPALDAVGRLVDLAMESSQTDAAPADLAQFLLGPTDYDWLVPGLMERRDRMILTAGEGLGKSYLGRQFGMRVAAGRDPFRAQVIHPRRVTLVDCENSDRQVRRHLARLNRTAEQDGTVPKPDMYFPVVKGTMDLTTRRDQTWLRDLMARTEPDLLIIGPLYKMFRGSPKDEDAADAASRILDAIRSRFGCAMLIEAHSPQAVGGKRDLRPIGSSLWLRWPEFGLGLEWVRSVTEGTDKSRPPRCRVVHWRGARDERSWPLYLKRGKRWPWLDENELEGEPWQTEAF